MNELTGLHINILEFLLFLLLLLFYDWRRSNRQKWSMFSDLIALLMSNMQTVIIGIIAILEVIKKLLKTIFLKTLFQ